MINVLIHRGQRLSIARKGLNFFRVCNQKIANRGPKFSNDVVPKFSVFCFRRERCDLVQGWSGETMGNSNLWLVETEYDYWYVIGGDWILICDWSGDLCRHLQGSAGLQAWRGLCSRGPGRHPDRAGTQVSWDWLTQPKCWPLIGPEWLAELWLVDG